MPGKIARSILIAGLLAAGTNVMASPKEGPICEYPHDFGYCGELRYEMKYHDNSGPEIFCNGESGRKCILRNQGVAPSPSWINCLPVDNYTVTCTVHPQGDMHFNWFTSHQLSPSNAPGWSGTTQNIHCNQPHGSGTVSVTITTPDGQSDTATTGISCGTIIH